MWSSSNCLAGLFRLIGYSMPSGGSGMVVGNSMAMLILLLGQVTNGFSLVATDIPPYIVWCAGFGEFGGGAAALGNGSSGGQAGRGKPGPRPAEALRFPHWAALARQ